MIRVRVGPEPIDAAAEQALAEAAPGAGAVAGFTGLVRADADGHAAVEVLELEHYPGVTEAVLTRLAERARDRWSLAHVSVVHRTGPMRPGERIVLVLACAAHRAAALEACAFLIDRLKTDAPFWKRETRGGEARWVEAREGDAERAAGWE